MGILKPDDPIARERGKVFQQRFKPPEGMKNIMGSMITSMIAWRLATHGDKSPITHQQYIDKEIDKEMRPSPRPRAVIEETKKNVERQAKRRMGYASTLATRGGGLGILDIRKKRVLGA